MTYPYKITDIDLASVFEDAMPLHLLFSTTSNSGYAISCAKSFFTRSTYKLMDGVCFLITTDSFAPDNIQIEKWGNGCLFLALPMGTDRYILNTHMKDQLNSLYVSGFSHNEAEKACYAKGQKCKGIAVLISEEGWNTLAESGSVSAELVQHLKARLSRSPFFTEKLPKFPRLMEKTEEVYFSIASSNDRNLLAVSAAIFDLVSYIIINLDVLWCNKSSEQIKGSFDVNEICYFLSRLENYNFSLDSLADNFGVSVSLIQKRFKQEMGYPISTYLKQLRIKRAKELLLDPTLSTEQVALQVGYSNKVSFGRAFREFTKTSIKHYKSSAT